MQARSALLPTLSARLSDVEQQVNLAAFGFSFSFPTIPGSAPIGIPSIVGPFNVFDARAYVSAPLLHLRALNTARASSQLARAADLMNRDARDTVVQVVAAGYLRVIADQARVGEQEVHGSHSL